jgi:hypothetical protein
MLETAKYQMMRASFRVLYAAILLTSFKARRKNDADENDRQPRQAASLLHRTQPHYECLHGWNAAFIKKSRTAKRTGFQPTGTRFF